MTTWTELEKTAQEAELIVAFFDLTNFQKTVRNWSSQDLSEFMGEYYEFVGEITAAHNGRLVKFLGDAGLIAFLPEDADNAARMLLELQEKGDAWLVGRPLRSRHIIKAHYGPMACGMFGTREEKRFDILGHTVNTAATLDSNGVAITPQLFRKLSPEMRQAFKKHTPPITYIANGDLHG